MSTSKVITAGIIIAWTPDRIRIGEIHPLGDHDIFGRELATFPGGELDDTMISRQHLEIKRDLKGTFQLRDLNSSNGTTINGATVNQTALTNGDWIRVGDTFLVFRHLPAGVPINQLWGLDSNLPSIGPAFGRIRQRASQLGPQLGPVLVVGPSGCGKETIAQQLHLKSRRIGEYRALNCSRETEADLDEALRATENGTLVLRHVGRLSKTAQERLVSAIDDNPQIRLVATSRRRIAVLRHDARLHPRLLACFGESIITVPPLNDHIEDLIPWVLHYLRLKNAGDRTLDPTLVNALFSVSWDDNYRQLKSILDTALLDEREVITLSRAVAKELLGVPTLNLSDRWERTFKKTAPY